MVAGGREGFQQLAGDGGRGCTKPSQDAGLSSGGGSQGHRDAALPVCGCVHIGMLVGRSTCSEGNVSGDFRVC